MNYERQQEVNPTFKEAFNNYIVSWKFEEIHIGFLHSILGSCSLLKCHILFFFSFLVRTLEIFSLVFQSRLHIVLRSKFIYATNLHHAHDKTAKWQNLCPTREWTWKQKRVFPNTIKRTFYPRDFILTKWLMNSFQLLNPSQY